MYNCGGTANDCAAIRGRRRVPLDVVRPGALRTQAGLRQVVVRDGQLGKLPGSVRELVGWKRPRQRSMEAIRQVQPYDPSRLAPSAARPRRAVVTRGESLVNLKNQVVEQPPLST